MFLEHLQIHLVYEYESSVWLSGLKGRETERETTEVKVQECDEPDFSLGTLMLSQARGILIWKFKSEKINKFIYIYILSFLFMFGFAYSNRLH